MELQQGAPAPKPRQDFSQVGNTVRIGTAYYRITGHKPPPEKGQAPIVELISHDLERRYEWQPHRGLRVIGGVPKRIRKRRPKGGAKAKGVQATAVTPPSSGPQAITRMSLWTRMVRAVRGH